jgi:phosphonoacetate hydrolase
MEYIEKATEAKMMPNLERIAKTRNARLGLAAAVMPTFTNPNNVGIMCGNTPRENGICGNYYFDEG